jgi:hypothetical protein
MGDFLKAEEMNNNSTKTMDTGFIVFTTTFHTCTPSPPTTI